MTATIPEQRRVAPVAEVQPVRLSRGRSVGGALRAAGRAGGEGCQRSVEFVAGRYVKSGLLAAGSWPWLPSDWRVAEIVAAGVVIGGAGLSGRRQSLLRVGQVLKYRRQVRKVVKRWPRVIGVNADINRVEKAVDLAGTPTRSPGHRHIPILLHGAKSWRLVKGLPRYFGPRRTPYGLVFTVDGSPTGAVSATIAAEMNVIASSMDAHSGSAYPNRWRAHWTDISLRWVDPFAEIIQSSQLPPPIEQLGVVLGIDSEGEPVEHSLWLPTLIIGRKGSGKSRVVRRLLQGLCESGQPFVVWVFDPKGRGQEFGWLRDAVMRYESEPDAWPQFVADLCTAMVDQAAALGALGMAECPTSDARFPLIVAVVDELGTALDETMNKKTITVGGSRTTVLKALSRCLRESRSAGVTIVANSQVAQKEKVTVRDLFDFTICLGVNNRETAQIATGDAKAFPAHMIPPHRRYAGIAYGNSADKGVTKFRNAYVNDGPESEAIANQIAAWTAFYQAAELKADGYHVSVLDQAVIDGLMRHAFDAYRIRCPHDL